MNARRFSPSRRPASMRSANIAACLLFRRSRSQCPICLYAFPLEAGARSGGHYSAFPAHHRHVEVEVVTHHAVSGEAALGGGAAVLRADLIDALDGVGHLL